MPGRDAAIARHRVPAPSAAGRTSQNARERRTNEDGDAPKEQRSSWRTSVSIAGSQYAGTGRRDWRPGAHAPGVARLVRAVLARRPAGARLPAIPRAHGAGRLDPRLLPRRVVHADVRARGLTGLRLAQAD